MCGIVGYVGKDRAAAVLVEGLRRLEYRGYDSAGIAQVVDGSMGVRRAVGRVHALEDVLPADWSGDIGIAHTRWATHGRVTEDNAHPHTDSANEIAVVHNGILDNVAVLRQRLEADGVVFRSETDSECLPHLIRKYYEGDPLAAVRQALSQVRGTYGIAVLFKDHPKLMVAARNGSPLVVGLGEDENFLASDGHALVRFTRQVMYLEDGEISAIRPDSVETTRLDGGQSSNEVEVLGDDFGSEEKGDFPHYMLKEIYEQPESIARCLRGRVIEAAGTARLGGMELSPRDLVKMSRVHVLGCGTSFHAGVLGAMAIEQVARVPSHAEVASEYRHRNPVIDPDGLYLAISQSGETWDTLEAIREVQLKGGQVFGVVNVVGSTVARTCGAGVYIHSGPEIAVASTKAFTSQVTALLIFTLMLGRSRALSPHRGKELAHSLLEVPDRVAECLADPGPIRQAVELLLKHRYALFIGRGPSWPVAMEGALKLKEIAYIPCEAYAAGEMKHGPIAMLEGGTPVVCVVPMDEHRDRTLNNISEAKARGASIIMVHTRGDDGARALADVSLPIPPTEPLISPLVSVVPLQLLAYEAALSLGLDIDRPRNLAKSVTVE